jgi:hypothetical protein
MPLLWHIFGMSKTDLIRGMEDTVAQVLKWGVGTEVAVKSLENTASERYNAP